MADFDTDINTLGVKALRELIARAGLSAHDCVEKADLKARALEAQAKLTAKAAVPEAADDKPTRTIASYECIVSAPSSPDFLVLVLHGYGATSNDFAQLPTMATVPGKEVCTYSLRKFVLLVESFSSQFR